MVKLLGLILLLPALALAQADYAREKRWADEIVPGIIVGDAVQLETPSGRTFLGIYAPANAGAAGVIVVHGLGVHPDWNLVGVLRSRLADQGYATLSIQMPVLPAHARAEQYAPLFPEAAERIAAAARYLRSKGHAKLAVVSHSLGARMTDYYLAHAADPGVSAWVTIGLSGTYSPGPLKMPVLDIFGERDNPAVRDNAAARAERLRSSPGSMQVEVAGADHFFSGEETSLTQYVRLFLDQKLR